jgi:predicted dehydrogenase
VAALDAAVAHIYHPVDVRHCFAPRATFAATACARPRVVRWWAVNRELTRRVAPAMEVDQVATVRWGILSTAHIGMSKVTPAIQRAEGCEVVAIASRDAAGAAQAAATLGIPRSHGSYEALLADPDVDAVYSPLPNHLHVPWAIQALEAGKHVLCEKPLAPTAPEAQQLVEAAAAHPHLKVMEAFMYRFHPQWQRARELVRGGQLGDLRAIHAWFSYFNTDPGNIRNQAGGGTLLDIGCYPISVARFLFEAEPARAVGNVEEDPSFHTDRLVTAILDFGRGTASFTCGTQLAPHQWVTIAGTRGQVDIEIPFNAPPDAPCRFWVQVDGTRTEERTAAVDQYSLQAAAFARAILDDTPVPTPLSDGIANLRVIDAIRASAAHGGWRALG